MATEKNISSRIINKHDSETNWNKATNFIPKAGEIIVYDRDANYSYERIKIGDGQTKVINLPFYLESNISGLISVNDIDTICATGLTIVSRDSGVF